MVSCTGAQFCPLGLIETKAPAERIMKKVDARVEVPKQLRIHWTGCPNSCGQAQVSIKDCTAITCKPKGVPSPQPTTHNPHTQPPQPTYPTSHAQAADIGIMGGPAKKLNPETGKMVAVPGCQIFVGGTIGESGHLSLEP